MTCLHFFGFNEFNNFFFNDICLVRDYQLNLPDPATPIMFGIHNLHNHILFFLCLILASVLFLLFSILFFFSFYDEKYYGLGYYVNFMYSAVYFALFYSVLFLLNLVSSFDVHLKLLRFRNVFSIRARLFNSSFPRIGYWALSLCFLVFSELSGLLSIFVQKLGNLLNFVYLEFTTSLGFFFSSLDLNKQSKLALHEERSLQLYGRSLFLKVRYAILRLSSLMGVARLLSNAVVFFELLALNTFSSLFSFNGVSRVLNYRFSLLEYSYTATFSSLKSFCQWFFVDGRCHKSFWALFSRFVNLKTEETFGSRRQWLTHLITHKQYRVTHNLNLEVIWTVIPTVILVFIAVPSFALLYSMDELLDPSITVKVIGHQWYWSYEYTDFKPLCNQVIKFDSYMVPDSDLQVGDLRLLKTDCPLILPKETNIRFLISSTDVLHSWAVPSFGIKMDAVPGRLNQTSTYVMEVGRYYGQCSELCGVNHAFMPIEICVVDPTDYYNWVFLKLSNG